MIFLPNLALAPRHTVFIRDYSGTTQTHRLLSLITHILLKEEIVGDAPGGYFQHHFSNAVFSYISLLVVNPCSRA